MFDKAPRGDYECATELILPLIDVHQHTFRLLPHGNGTIVCIFNRATSISIGFGDMSDLRAYATAWKRYRRRARKFEGIMHK